MPRPYRVVDFIYCNNRKVAPHPSPAVTASPPKGKPYMGGLPGRLAMPHKTACIFVVDRVLNR